MKDLSAQFLALPDPVLSDSREDDRATNSPSPPRVHASSLLHPATTQEQHEDFEFLSHYPSDTSLSSLARDEPPPPPPKWMRKASEPTSHPAMEPFSLYPPPSSVEVEIIEENDYESGVPLPALPTMSLENNQRKSWRRRKPKQVYNQKFLKELRWAILKNRVSVHEKRNALKHKRAVALDADVRLMKAFREIVTRSPSLKGGEILNLYDECQQARNEYQPLEDDYNALENQLDREEYEFQQVEEKFYERQDQQAPDFLGDPDEPVIFEEPNDSAASSHSTMTISYQPLPVIEYLSRIGDRDLIRERLEELGALHEEIVGKQSVRFAYNIPLDPESQTILDDFDAKQRQLLSRLTDIESDVDRLRRECENDGLLYPSGVPILGEDGDHFDLENIEPHRDPFLILDSDSGVRFSDVTPDPGKTRISGSKYINKWLLGRLRGSYSELRRMKDMLQFEGINLDSQTFVKRLLEWWSKDETTKESPPHSRTGARMLSLVYDFAADFGEGASVAGQEHFDPRGELIRANSV